MLTVDALRGFGANVDEGLQRCMNNEAFYLRLVPMAVNDAGFDKLQITLNARDLDAAFEAAHALKGVLGNLSLTPLYELISEMTELLRARQEVDYGPMLEDILAKRAALASLCG